MAKKPDPLNDLLAKSFTAPPKPQPEVPAPPAELPASAPEIVPPTLTGAGEQLPPVPEVPRKSPAARKAPEPEPAVSESAPEFEGVRKTTVSFYAAEQARVDLILDALLKSRRHRGGFSDAIKIALRLCPVDPAQIGKAWDEARAADKRTQRGKS